MIWSVRTVRVRLETIPERRIRAVIDTKCKRIHRCKAASIRSAAPTSGQGSRRSLPGLAGHVAESRLHHHVAREVAKATPLTVELRAVRGGRVCGRGGRGKDHRLRVRRA